MNNITKRQLPLPIFAIALVALMIFSVGEYVYLNNEIKMAESGIHISGSIKILQNGMVVRSLPDAIQNGGGEDTILCYIFNNTNECTNATGYYGTSSGNIGTACQYWKGSSAPSLTNGFFSNSLCTFTAVALSTDNTQVTTNTGCPVLTASGLSPVKASQVQTPVGTNENSIVLTASYSPTGTQTINKLCLIAWNVHSATYSSVNGLTLGNGATAAFAFAIDAVSPSYTTTNGVPFTVQWTITLSFS